MVWKIIVKLYKKKKIIYIRKVPCKSCGYIYTKRILEKCLKCGNRIINQECDFKKRNELPHYLIRSNNFGMENEKQDDKYRENSYFFNVLQELVNDSNFVQYEKFCWAFNRKGLEDKREVILVSKFICRINHRADKKIFEEFSKSVEELWGDALTDPTFLICCIIEVIIDVLTGGIETEWYFDYFYDSLHNFANKFIDDNDFRFKMKYLLPLPMNFKMKQKITKKINIILLDHPLDNV